jgi:excisionase family DNA binding protein
MVHPNTEKLSYRINEAAYALGFSRSQIYALMDTGALRYIQVGGVRLIPASELERLISGGTSAQAAS